jgi:hypothetical protein
VGWAWWGVLYVSADYVQGAGAGPRLVFVHGIGSRRDPRDTKRKWIAALAEGARRAGHRDFAVELESEEQVDVVFAYYGDLFDEPGSQGHDQTQDQDQALMLPGLLLDLIEAQLAESSAGPEADQLNHARDQLVSDGVAQGPGSVARQVLNAATGLLAFGPLSRAGQWAGGKLLVRDLAQVARYLGRGEFDADGRSLDRRIRSRFHEALGDGPAVVVAHSLGSVVALEGLHDPGSAAAVPLLVTVGSPLAMRTVVWPRLRPRPPSTPDRVERWLNFWDRDDLIVARPRLEELFDANVHGVAPVTERVDSEGLWVHTATKYLDKPGVAGPIAEALQRIGGADRR